MAPGDVCHGPRCTLAGLGPVTLEYRSCHWPGGSAGSPQRVRPMGCWFFPVPRPPYVCAVSWATWLLFTGVRARCVALRLRCPGPLGSCSPVCPRGLSRCVCGVLGHLAPFHRCACSLCCVVCAVSWATWLLFHFRAYISDNSYIPSFWFQFARDRRCQVSYHPATSHPESGYATTHSPHNIFSLKCCFCTLLGCVSHRFFLTRLCKKLSQMRCAHRSCHHCCLFSHNYEPLGVTQPNKFAFPQQLNEHPPSFHSSNIRIRSSASSQSPCSPNLLLNLRPTSCEKYFITFSFWLDVARGRRRKVLHPFFTNHQETRLAPIAAQFESNAKLIPACRVVAPTSFLLTSILPPPRTITKNVSSENRPKLPPFPSTSPLKKPTKHNPGIQPTNPPTELRLVSHNLQKRNNSATQILFHLHNRANIIATQETIHTFPSLLGYESSKILQKIGRTTRRGTSLIFSPRIAPLASELIKDPRGLITRALLRLPGNAPILVICIYAPPQDEEARDYIV